MDVPIICRDVYHKWKFQFFFLLLFLNILCHECYDVLLCLMVYLYNIFFSIPFFIQINVYFPPILSAGISWWLDIHCYFFLSSLIARERRVNEHLLLVFKIILLGHHEKRKNLNIRGTTVNFFFFFFSDILMKILIFKNAINSSVF